LDRIGHTVQSGGVNPNSNLNPNPNRPVRSGAVFRQTEKVVPILFVVWTEV